MFITFEGIEGSGKTTQIRRVCRYLESKGRNCLSTREPGDTKIGRKIRQILLDPDNGEMVPQAELFLYAADRAQHIRERIIPALDEGKTVICDRFSDATTVYQGYARGIDLALVRDINRQVLGSLKPDLTLLFDLDPETGLQRAWKDIDGGERSGGESRFEREALVFHQKVRNGYLEISRMEPERIVVVDASLNEDDVFEHIRRILADRFSLEPLI
jgi:dTMP kinase